MTDLTEQWKKGELPEGWYYVKGNRAKGIYAYTAEYLNNIYRPVNSERIVEPVPSYEEWNKLNNACHELEKEAACLTVDNVNLKKWCEEFNALNVAKENTKLKELLKECREEIGDEIDDCTDPKIELFAKINQALGEDK